MTRWRLAHYGGGRERWGLAHREGGPEVPDVPGGDDVVVAAHQSGHHCRAFGEHPFGDYPSCFYLYTFWINNKCFVSIVSTLINKFFFFYPLSLGTTEINIE